MHSRGPSGLALIFTGGEVVAFLVGVKDGKFDDVAAEPASSAGVWLGGWHARIMRNGSPSSSGMREDARTENPGNVSLLVHL